MPRFEFAFAPAYRAAALAFGVTPGRAWVDVSADQVEVRFGWWRLRTPCANVVSVTETGPYSFLKTAGPAHLSFTDRGVTFATNGDRGLCLDFREPVPAIDPLGRIRHPGATVTVADVDGLRAALQL